MLVLTRRLNQKILFPSIRASVQVVAVKPGVVRIGIDAPADVLILREEIAGNLPAADRAHEAPGHLLSLNGLVQKRLEVLNAGLAVMRAQLAAGNPEDAAATLDELEDEVHLLRQRLSGEVIRPSVILAPTPRRALLVEYNDSERELLASYLRSTGFDVATASDGSDALDYLRSHARPDVVLLDMGLPRFGGAATVRAVRKDPQCAGVKIFAVTGHRPEEFDLGSGVDRWFLKPIDPVALCRALQ